MSLTLAFAVAVGLLSTQAAPAPAAAPVASATATAVTSARPVFSVVPGGVGSPLGAIPRGGPARVVWTGFQMIDGGSRVFVQTSAEVRLDLATNKDGVKMTLHNCRVHMRNNSRTLDTRFFSSPVQQVVVHQRRHDVELEIALNAPAQPTSRQQTGTDGSHFWVIDFAPQDKPAPAPEKSVSLK